jgi:hypothetical protein
MLTKDIFIEHQWMDVFNYIVAFFEKKDKEETKVKI